MTDAEDLTSCINILNKFLAVPVNQQITVIYAIFTVRDCIGYVSIAKND